MIKKGNNNIEAVYKGTTEIASIYKGTTLVYENFKDKIVSGTNTILLSNAKPNSLNYLKLYGGTTQKDSELPIGYKRLNYIANTSSTKVNTGIKPSVDDIEMELKVRAATGSWYIFQARASTSGTQFGFSGANATGSIGFNWAGNSLASGITRTSDRHILTLKGTAKNGEMTLYVKDETSGVEDTKARTYTTPVTTFPTTPIFIWGNSNSSQTVATNSYVYYAKIKVGGELVMDYVPAFNQKEFTRGGFYDTVSKTFTVSGSIDGGTEITQTPSPSNIMPIVCNNGKLKLRNTSGLPLSYTKLKYIQNSGTQYIETGITATTNTGINISYSYPRISSSVVAPVCGIYTPGSAVNRKDALLISTASGYTNAKIFFACCGALLNTQISATANTIYNPKLNWLNDGKMQLGEIVENVGTNGIVNTVPLRLFSRYNNSEETWSISESRIYQAQFSEGNEIIHNFIPAKRNSDNEIGMYDTVSETFFTNAGTGTFISGGNDDQVEIYTDGFSEKIAFNLFDKTNITQGYYVRGEVASSGYSVGELNANSAWNCSDYIKISPNTQYTLVIPTYSNATSAGVALYENTTVESAITGYATNTMGGSTFTFTSPANCNYIRFSWPNPYGDECVLFRNGTELTSQNLCKINNTYIDNQEILTGNITKRVGILYFTGEETWTKNTVSETDIEYFRCDNFIPTGYNANTVKTVACKCSHFVGRNPSTGVSNMNDNEIKCGYYSGSSYYRNVYLKCPSFDTAEEVQAYMKEQYEGGTPVIIAYPLSTSKTETTTGQSMMLSKGDNIISVSQASIESLNLEAKYKGK